MNYLINAYKLLAIGFIVMMCTINFNMVSSIGMIVCCVIIMIALVIAICMTTSESIGNILFISFSGITGLILNPVVMNRNIPSEAVFIALALTVVMFVSLSLYAIFSGKDFSALNGFATVSLVILIVAGTINIFVNSSFLLIMLSAAGVIVFSIFMLVSTQDIMYNGHHNTTAMNALSLFLNIINLFMDLLNLVFSFLNDD